MSAHQEASLTWYLAKTDAVCLANVTSSQGNKITFTVKEILRGKPQPVLTLLAYPGENYLVNTEWLLVSCPGGFRDCVGWAMKGDCEWIPGAVLHDGDITYIKDWEFGTPKVPKGYSLDQIKQLLAEKSTKP